MPNCEGFVLENKGKKNGTRILSPKRIFDRVLTKINVGQRTSDGYGLAEITTKAVEILCY